MVARYNKKTRIEEDPSIQNYYKELYINELDSGISADAYYINRLAKMQVDLNNYIVILHDVEISENER